MSGTPSSSPLTDPPDSEKFLEACRRLRELGASSFKWGDMAVTFGSRPPGMPDLSQMDDFQRDEWLTHQREKWKKQRAALEQYKRDMLFRSSDG